MTLEASSRNGMIDFYNKIIEYFPADSDYVRFAKKRLERERKESQTHIKRRIYDPSPLYPDEDEVYEFYVGRSDG